MVFSLFTIVVDTRRGYCKNCSQSGCRIRNSLDSKRARGVKAARHG